MMKPFLITLCLWMPFFGMAQSVTNVRAAQRAGTKLVDVYYDLSGADGPATVQVAVSDNGGSSYAVTAISFTGDVDGGVTNGGNKHVVWNAAADWNGQFSQAVRFCITATALPPILEEFALIPAGSFSMGDSFTGGSLGELPVHTVYVSAFFMAKYEVTKVIWDEVRAWGLNNGYTDLPIGSGKAANHPVHAINWYAVVQWCNARSQKEGLTACYTVSGSIYKTGSNDAAACNWNASGYRLPTEAEWEKAARGESGRRFPWGDTINHSNANYRANSTAYTYDTSGYTSFTYHPSYTSGGTPYTSPVGSFTANGYSLHDTAGNVWERCWDLYSNYSSSPDSDPRGAVSGTGRVYRGGPWDGGASGYRAKEVLTQLESGHQPAESVKEVPVATSVPAKARKKQRSDEDAGQMSLFG